MGLLTSWRSEELIALREDNSGLVHCRPREMSYLGMIRATKIRHYVSTMQERGFAPREVLAGTRIDPESLADNAFLVRLDQCKAVVSNIIRLTGDQGIGFEIGKNVDPSNLGVASQVVMSCRTVRDSIELWARYSNALLGTLIAIKLEEEKDGGWSLVFSEIIPMGFMYNFCVEEYLMIIRKLGLALSHQSIRIRTLELSYPAPVHRDSYREHLECEPTFNRSITRLTAESPHLDALLPGSDDDFNNLCRTHCSHIMRQIADNSGLIAQLRSLMLSRPGRVPTLNEAAEGLHMSPRTLRRRLQDESYTYHRIVDEYRLETAKEYLATAENSTKEISYLLGFKDPNVFRSTFKKWTGQTVTEYKASQAISLEKTL